MRSLLWTGYRWDDTIGLYDAKARFYDPELGQFTQPDSLVPEPYHPISLNRYAYTYNSPVNFTDSSGHFIDTLWDAFDLGANLRNCLGDTDSLSCYMVPLAAAAVVLPGLTTGPVDNAIRAARGIENNVGGVAKIAGGGGSQSSFLIRNGVGRYNPGDLEAITRFSAKARLINEDKSFGDTWKLLAEYGLTDNLWVYRSGDEIVGAMLVGAPIQIDYRYSKMAFPVALEIKDLESIQKGAGISLLKEGVYESQRLGLNGRIFYVSAPNNVALPYHTYLARVTGADSYLMTGGRYFYYDEIAAQNLLNKPVRFR